MVSHLRFSSWREQIHTCTGDVRCNFRVQAATGTASVEHKINPFALVRQTQLLDAVIIVQPRQRGHDVVFGAVLDEGQRVFVQ